MSDFSEKYNSALEEIEISPDFIERTEKMMIELRDEKRSHKITVSRFGLSTAAAAAACIAAVIAAGRMGAFDKLPTEELPDVTAPAQVTEIRESSPETTAGFEEQVEAVINDTVPAVEETIEQAEQPVSEEAPAEDEISSAVTEAVVEAAVTPAPAELPEPAKDDDITADSTDTVTSAAEEIYAPSEPVLEAEEEVYVEEFISGEEVYVPPVAESRIITDPTPRTETDIIEDEAEAIVEEAYPTAEDVDGGEGISAGDGSGEGISGSGDVTSEAFEAARLEKAASDFSSESALTRKKYSTLSITPNFEEYSETEGGLIALDPLFTENTEEIKNIIEDIAYCTKEKTCSLQLEAPSGSRYIIDLADDQGSCLRIYTGNNYIAFMSSGAYGAEYYVFSPEAEEMNALDALLREHIG